MKKIKNIFLKFNLVSSVAVVVLITTQYNLLDKKDNEIDDIPSHHSIDTFDIPSHHGKDN